MSLVIEEDNGPAVIVMGSYCNESAMTKNLSTSTSYEKASPKCDEKALNNCWMNIRLAPRTNVTVSATVIGKPQTSTA